MTSELFYDLPVECLNSLIIYEGKAKSVCKRSQGFSGEIVFLDNGENVFPRYIAAKYPRNDKRLSPGERAKRFLRELELQASAHYHPNVHWPFHTCMILGVPVAYFRGWEGDLSNYIEDSSFGDNDRISFIIQLIEGLLHCNERQLIHQDLKPENIFIRDLRKYFLGLPDYSLWFCPKVADFGSVNLGSEKKIYKGSRPYMAPEQWQKKSLGEWTNVFAIGIILHELMSRGVHPIGVHGGDWHRENNPWFNRWQNDEYWEKWVEDKCPVAKPIANKNLAGIVANCLALCPSRRTNLFDVQQGLLDELAVQSPIARNQVKLDINQAKSLACPEGEWEHLNEQLKSLKREIEMTYPPN